MTPPTAGHVLLLEELARGHDGAPLPGPTKDSAIARGYVAHGLDGGLALTEDGREVLGRERLAILAAQGRVLAGEHGDAGTLELAVRQALGFGAAMWAQTVGAEVCGDDLPGRQYRALAAAGVLVDDDQPGGGR